MWLPFSPMGASAESTKNFPKPCYPELSPAARKEEAQPLASNSNDALFSSSIDKSPSLLQQSRPVIRHFVLALVLSSAALAQTVEKAVGYSVSLERRTEHIVHVSVRVPRSPAGTHELILPVWNALYQVRDFSQYVIRYSA